MKRFSKLMVVLLTMLMVLECFAMPALAATPTSGKCGDNIKWKLSSGTLTISGKGEMYDYDYSGFGPYFMPTPWRESKALGKAIKKIVIKSGVTYLGDFSFCDLPNVTSVSVPGTVEDMGQNVFYNDKKLSSASLASGLTVIGTEMFEDCYALTNVKIPSTVTEIRGGAFSGCIKLSKINLPKQITEIDSRTFEFTALTSITIPEGVTEIGNSAFASCEKLKSVNLPESLLEIDPCAFEHSGLTSIKIPHNVTNIRGDAFGFCYKLKTIRFFGEMPDFDSGVFNCSTVTAYYPSNLESWSEDALENYEGTITWKPYKALKLLNEFDGFVTAGYNENITLTVEAEGSELSYQWYYADEDPDADPDEDPVFKKASSKTNTYTVAMTPARNGRMVYCVVKDKYGSRISTETVTLDMEITPMTVNTLPVSVTVKHGETATVSVDVEGDGLTYAWYYAAPNSDTFKKTSNTTNTYSVTMNTKVDGRKLYCVVKDAYGEVLETNVVTISMQKIPFNLIKAPEDVTAKYGEEVTLSVEAEGDGLTYTWYYTKAGEKKFTKASSQTNTYSVTMKKAQDGRKVYCVVKDAYGKKVKTDVVTLTLDRTSLALVKAPENMTVKFGEKVELTVEAEGDGLTYTWYYTKAGEKKFTKASVTTNTYSFTMKKAQNGRKVYCVVKDAYGKKIKTDVITLTLEKTPLEITAQPVSVTVKKGETATVSVEAAGDGLTYVWYYAKAGAKKFSKSSTTTNTYSVVMNADRDGRQLYCLIKDAYGKTIKTEIVSIYMDKAE